MNPHPQLDLLIHSDEELEAALGEAIVARDGMHLWPLSTVELLTMASGRRWVYKVQGEPTVEPELLSLAQTDLLPACTVLQRDERQAALLLPFIESPTLCDVPPDEASLVAHGRAVIRQIGEIGGDVPVYRDLGTVAAWRALAEETLALLSALIRYGAFTRVNGEDVAALAQWAETGEVLRAVDETSQLINGDLTAEHVFLTPDGYRVIDWQRPYRAPAEIDLVSLLDSREVPAERYVAPAIIGLRWFLFVHWVAEAKTHWLPDSPLDDWARDGIDRVRSSGGQGVRGN